MADDDVNEASAEQKINIATYFIMSAPTGEVDEVVHDVMKLVSDNSTLDEKTMTNILREYNTDQLTPALDPSGGNRMIIVSKYNQVGPDLYLDPNSGKIFKFDQNKRIFTDDTDKRAVIEEKTENFRSAVQRGVDSYIGDNYKGGKAIANVFGSDGGNLTIAITARNVNLGNYWTGGWRSVYVVSISSTGKKEIKGSVKLNVHYFEDGNVQLHSSIDHSQSVQISSNADETAKAISKAIGDFETDFQNNLEEMYVNMHRSTFKAMRRFLPINKQKFNWNPAAHQLAQEVSNK